MDVMNFGGFTCSQLAEMKDSVEREIERRRAEDEVVLPRLIATTEEAMFSRHCRIVHVIGEPEMVGKVGRHVIGLAMVSGPSTVVVPTSKVAALDGHVGCVQASSLKGLISRTHKFVVVQDLQACADAAAVGVQTLFDDANQLIHGSRYGTGKLILIGGSPIESRAGMVVITCRSAV